MYVGEKLDVVEVSCPVRSRRTIPASCPSPDTNEMVVRALTSARVLQPPALHDRMKFLPLHLQILREAITLLSHPVFPAPSTVYVAKASNSAMYARAGRPDSVNSK